MLHHTGATPEQRQGRLYRSCDGGFGSFDRQKNIEKQLPVTIAGGGKGKIREQSTDNRLQIAEEICLR